MKEGQLSKVFALKIKRELEKEGKQVQLFALTDITNERLRNLKGVDAFIQVACPRISTDNQFDKPVLSTPQANALLKILRKEEHRRIFGNSTLVIVKKIIVEILFHQIIFEKTLNSLLLFYI